MSQPPSPEQIHKLLRDSLRCTRDARAQHVGDIVLSDAAVDELARNAAQVIVFALDREQLELDAPAAAVVEGAAVERGIVKALDTWGATIARSPHVEPNPPRPRARLLAEDVDRGNSFGFDLGGEG